MRSPSPPVRFSLRLLLMAAGLLASLMEASAGERGTRSMDQGNLHRLAPELRAWGTGAGAAAMPAPIDVLVWFEESAPADAPPATAALRTAAEQNEVQRRVRRITLTAAALRARLANRGGGPEWLRGYRHLPAAQFRVRNADELARLAADPAVRRVERDLQLQAHLAQSLPLIGQPVAVSRGVTGAGSAVVVLDTGLNYTRSEFGCSAPGVPAGCRVVHAEDIAPQDGQLDTTGHGTNVAAIIAGVAPGVDLIGLDVFNGSTAGLSAVLAGINWAIQHRDTYGIVAINMSLGFNGAFYSAPCPSVISGYVGTSPIYSFFNPFHEAILAAEAAGISVVASAGNEAELDGLPLPACTPEVISVGAVYKAPAGARNWPACSDATTATDQVACFSNASDHLVLLAPGALINAGGSTWGGTSQAAPHVAGAVAMVNEVWPGSSPQAVRARLVDAAEPVLDTRRLPSRVFPRLDLASTFPLPGNDAFASALSLTGDSVQWSGSNLLASLEAGEPLHAGQAGGASVWFEWTPLTSTRFRLSTQGSAIDTLLAVYSGTSLSGLVSVASDDDSAGNGSSELLLDAVAGQIYRIAIDGKGGSTGGLLLDIAPSATADLAVAVALTPAAVSAGGSTVARLSASNAGPITAANTLLQLGLPAGITAGTPLAPGCFPGGPGLQCALGSLAAGATVVLDAPLRTSAAGEFFISASLTSNGTPDPRPHDNTATASLAVLAPADLGLTLQLPLAPVPANGSFDVTATVANLGPGEARAASLDFTLQGAGTVEQAPAGCAPEAGGLWVCSLGDLPTGSSSEQLWRLRAGDPGILSLSASVASQAADPDPGNQAAQAELTVLAMPDLFLVAEGTASAEAAGIMAEVYNNGAAAASGVAVTFSLPTEVSPVSLPAVCSAETGSVRCDLGGLAPDGGPATVALNLRASTAGSWLVPVTATATEPDADPQNNTREVNIVLVASPTGGPEPTQVPAMPWWALSALGLWAGTAGLRGIRAAGHRARTASR
jgi:hypothetical protein